MLELRFLGEIEIVRDGVRQAAPRSRKTLALLAYLALTGRRHHRNRLCALLWALPSDPRASLCWSLSKLRPLVDEPDCRRIVADRDAVAFEARGAEVDFLRLQDARAAGLAELDKDALLQLSALFRGDFLEEFDLPDCPDFQAWIVAERRELRALRAAIQHELAERSAETEGQDHRDKPSLAVLPFSNVSGDPDQEYFADGITEDVITALSKFGLFFVISRNSTLPYRDATFDLPRIAHELGARYLVEGSVRRLGSRVRISIRLLDGPADRHIWAERYDRDLEDVFDVQDDITSRIATSIAPEYLSAEMLRARRVPARSLNAWDAFIRGYWHLMRFTKDDNARAQASLAEAIELDPQRAAHFGVLAVTHVMDALYDWGESWTDSIGRGREYANQAVALDEHETVAVRALGLVELYSKNHPEAKREFERAIELNPDEAENHALLGAALGTSGDFEGGLRCTEHAIRLSPRDPHMATWYSYLSMSAALAGRNVEAVAWANKAVILNPRFAGGYRTLAVSLGHLGRLDEARTALATLLGLLPDLNVGSLREQLPIHRAEDLDTYLEGLHLAGLPR